MTIAARTVLGLSQIALVAACHGAIDPAEAQVAADGTEAMVASTQSTSLAGAVFANVTVADPLKAAAELGAPTQIWPSGCVARSRDANDPAVAHVVFTDCTGPFGLVHIDGEELVTFSAGSGGALHVVITGVNLTAGGQPIVYSATLDITFPTATTRTAIWQGTWTRTNDAGVTVAHTSDLVIAVDTVAGCRTSDGSARTMVASRQIDTSLRGYQVCHDLTTGAEGCPSGSVIHTGEPSGRVIAIDFDASDVADVTGARGDTFEVNLGCTSIGH